MGAYVEGFVEAIATWPCSSTPTSITRDDRAAPSKGGNYLGLTITITATNREQLDRLYRTLTTHPMVRLCCDRQTIGAGRVPAHARHDACLHRRARRQHSR